jgi:hypothetical protein
MNTNTTAAQPLDLDSLSTYDPDFDDGYMRCRDQYKDGDYFKVEDVRALIAKARAAKPAGAADTTASASGNAHDVLIELCDQLDGLRRRLRHTPGTGQNHSYLLYEDVAECIAEARAAVAGAPEDDAAHPVQAGEAVDEQELHARIVKVLSEHRMVLMFEVEDGGALGNSYPLIDRLSLENVDEEQYVASGKEEIDAIAWAIVGALPETVADNAKMRIVANRVHKRDCTCEKCLAEMDEKFSGRASLAPVSAQQPDMSDAYVGAREDVAIWKKRALEAEESCRRLTAALNAENGPTFMGEPVSAQQGAAVAPTPVHVECRECRSCQHVGINDATDTKAACHNCDWSGPTPSEDHCPGCAATNCMGASCPKCGALYSLLAETGMALDLINPDGLDDRDQLDDELTFGIVQHKDDDGKVSTGMCCWNDDTEGVLPLDGEYGVEAVHAQQPAAPAAWIQYVDGVKTQNVARDEAEKAEIERIAAIMNPRLKTTWETLFAAPTAGAAPSQGHIGLRSDYDVD